MSKKLLVLALVFVMAVPFFGASAQDGEDLPRIGFLPGVVDPFYQVMELGVNAAAADFGLEVVTQYPDTWGPTVQTPILDAMVARGDLDYIITAPVDREQMIAPLEAAIEAGIKIITVDTFVGDGDYVNGPVTFPLSYIGSDNVEGGRIAGRAGQALGGEQGLYREHERRRQHDRQRSQGFREAIAGIRAWKWSVKNTRWTTRTPLPADGGRAPARARSGRYLRRERLQRAGRR